MASERKRRRQAAHRRNLNGSAQAVWEVRQRIQDEQHRQRKHKK